MKTILKLSLLVMLCYAQIFAQSYDKNKLDSLFNAYTAIRTQKTLKTNTVSGAKLPVKCAMPLAAEIKINLNNFNAVQKAVLKPLLDRPQMQTSIVSPQKHYRIYYDTTGYNAPGYSVTDFAIALDSAYNFEINYLGYPPAPVNSATNGDDYYDIFVVNLGDEYGETDLEDNITPSTYYTYMKIDNDFAGFPTTGINAARVTAAHEYHHGIQLGNYIYRSADLFFHELTSTSMEEFVYNTVNDYYNYMSNYFQNPSRSFSENNTSYGDGYDLAIWNIFQKEKFGFDVIKREWELMRQYRAIKAIDMTLKEQNATFIEQYNVFGLWCYFTKSRSVANKYFPEAANYPLIKTNANYYMAPPSTTDISMTSYAASNNYLNIMNTSAMDTLMIVVTNGDVQAAVASSDSTESCAFSLSNSSRSGYSQISSSYYTKLTPADNLYYWLQSGILNNVILDGNIVSSLANIDYPFPSPFSYKKNSQIYMPVTNSEVGVVDFNIYSPSMKLVYSSSQQVKKYLNNKVIQWNGLDKDGNKLASGVYIYAIRAAGETLKGKLVIVK
jgi:hypothetical protein